MIVYYKTEYYKHTTENIDVSTKLDLRSAHRLIVTRTECVISYLLEKDYTLFKIKCGGDSCLHDGIAPFTETYMSLESFSSNAWKDYVEEYKALSTYNLNFNSTWSFLRKGNSLFIQVSLGRVPRVRIESFDKDILLHTTGILQSVSLPNSVKMILSEAKELRELKAHDDYFRGSYF